jgi:hypothetical protein
MQLYIAVADSWDGSFTRDLLPVRSAESFRNPSPDAQIFPDRDIRSRPCSNEPVIGCTLHCVLGSKKLIMSCQLIISVDGLVVERDEPTVALPSEAVKDSELLNNIACNGNTGDICPLPVSEEALTWWITLKGDNAGCLGVHELAAAMQVLIALHLPRLQMF